MRPQMHRAGALLCGAICLAWVSGVSAFAAPVRVSTVPQPRVGPLRQLRVSAAGAADGSGWLGV